MEAKLMPLIRSQHHAAGKSFNVTGSCRSSRKKKCAYGCDVGALLFTTTVWSMMLICDCERSPSSEGLLDFYWGVKNRNLLTGITLKTIVGHELFEIGYK